MRADPIVFALQTQRANRKPQFIIKIEYDVGSIYLTSHTGIPSVPGDVIYGVVARPSSVSQRIYPDEGRSDIGSFNFTVIDKDKQLTEALRAQLQDNAAGLRGNRVKFYLGYKGFDYTSFVLFTTQIVIGASYYQGLYTVRCADITREQRSEVFEPVSTTLTETITASSSTILCNDASRFIMVAHGTSYSDAPSATVGYIRIEDEIIRYTGTTAGSFTGCARGVFNTRAAEHAIDPTTPQSRRTKVEEFIYLEMPGPKLAYAVMTGEIYGTANRLPEHWHLGIEPSLVRLSDYTNIGPDLWNPADDSDPATFIFRFDGLKGLAGKTFLEKEINLLMGCFSPVYADGTVGLRRRVPIISQAAGVVTLTEDNIVSMDELEHDFDGMHNFLQVLWAYDELQDDFLRRTVFIDEESIAIHGRSKRLDYSFRGLHSQRAGDSTIAQRLDSMRDAYNEPPQNLNVTVLGSLNGLEVGDVVRVRVPETILRDFAQDAGDYNRAFEIQQRTYDAYSGDVSLQLFGSTSRPLGLPFGDNPNNLPDSFYDSEGTALGTVITITSGTMATGSHTLTGNASLTASGAIYYYIGDLIIPQGCNITITANVQLRIMGFLTLNGTINGVGGGQAGVSDPGTGAWDATFAGNPGFIGHSRGWDGIRAVALGRFPAGDTIPAVFTRGAYDVFPVLTISVVDGDLVGLPNDMRGTGGAPGGRVVNTNNSIVAVGGAGVDGGAGLCIICRGMALGASATITLDGEPSAVTTLQSVTGDAHVYPGSGGAGGPGAFLLLLDGDNISAPVIDSANFSAKTGAIPQLGIPLPTRHVNILTQQAFGDVPEGDKAGFADPAIINAQDLSAAARLIQYVPPTDDPSDTTDAPPAPSALTASHVGGGNALQYIIPDSGSFDAIEVYASIDNDRTNAVKVGESRSTSFFHALPLGGLRYYWIRSKINPVDGRIARFSTFEPASSVGGVASNADSPGELEDAPGGFTIRGLTNGIIFSWALPAYARLLGLIRLYEHTSPTPFSSASLLWEGYGMEVFVPKEDTTTRYYWIVLNRSGVLSVPNPPVVGLPGAASDAVSTLYVTAFPVFLSKSAGVPPTSPYTLTTDATVATASGGTPPYTYAWTWANGGTGITINSPTADTTTFSGTHVSDGTVLTGTAMITVTDAASATATYAVAVQLSWPSTA
jgi:hypothetical protein